MRETHHEASPLSSEEETARCQPYSREWMIRCTSSQSSTQTSIKNDTFPKLILLETSHFLLVIKPKHPKSGLCSRTINLRQVLFLIDIGVKSRITSSFFNACRSTWMVKITQSLLNAFNTPSDHFQMHSISPPSLEQS